MENNETTPKPAEAAQPQRPPMRPSMGPPRRPGGRRFTPRRKVCRLCAEHIDLVDYKQSQIIKSFCTESGKILSRRITGACAKHQRQIMRAVKINRNLSLMSYNG
jgi:small subunit ribosomal protein S18